MCNNKLEVYLKPALRDAILSNSVSKILDEAVKEWRATHYEISSPGMKTNCVCDKENIVHCFEITNIHNNNTLYPIGCDCIAKFKNPDLTKEIKLYEHKYKIFKNKGKRNCGKSYDWICNNDTQYLEFLRKTPLRKQCYMKLLDYYEKVFLVNEQE